MVFVFNKTPLFVSAVCNIQLKNNSSNGQTASSFGRPKEVVSLEEKVKDLTTTIDGYKKSITKLEREKEDLEIAKNDAESDKLEAEKAKQKAEKEKTKIEREKKRLETESSKFTDCSLLVSYFFYVPSQNKKQWLSSEISSVT